MAASGPDGRNLLFWWTPPKPPNYPRTPPKKFPIPQALDIPLPLPLHSRILLSPVTCLPCLISGRLHEDCFFMLAQPSQRHLLVSRLALLPHLCLFLFLKVLLYTLFATLFAEPTVNPSPPPPPPLQNRSFFARPRARALKAGPGPGHRDRPPATGTGRGTGPPGRLPGRATGTGHRDRAGTGPRDRATGTGPPEFATSGEGLRARDFLVSQKAV